MRTLAQLPLVVFLIGLTSLPVSRVRGGPADVGYLGGLVQSSRGPEAGVWVIAESDELQTKFVKIVVTDDKGRFVLPDLPHVTYRVWVRGYGLEDSAPSTLKPSAASVTLRVSVARSQKEAAKVYPANYWLSMLEPPGGTEFPGSGDRGNGLATAMLKQDDWLYKFKLECNWCHQLGNQLSRSLDHVFKAKPELKATQEAWEWRLGTGVPGQIMYATVMTLGPRRTTKILADWTDRIARGELPPVPPRPTGIERNLVVTLWDWGTDKSFMHDQVATSRYDPRVNAGGPVYGASLTLGALTVLDPREHRTFELEIPTRAPRAEVPSRFRPPNRPSLHWGSEYLWTNPPDNPADPHSPTIDSKGRVWVTSKIRPAQNPAWCADPANPFAEWFPLRNSVRQVALYDPGNGQFTLIDTCYSTHHLQFDADASETLYFDESVGPIIGWIDTKIYDETGDEQKAVGWCGQVLDTNGDGRITKPWNPSSDREQQVFDRRLDTEVAYNLNSITVSPLDHSIWGASDEFPGYVVRLERGGRPPSTCKAEVYRVPARSFGPRGIDVDRDGVIWTALAVSGHLASFDRRKCKFFSGPTIRDGAQCPEGWTLYPSPGPKLQGTDLSADFHGYNWVDRYNALGLGENVPLASGTNSDALLALNPRSGQWINLRVPYPLGFYPGGVDGRIDDPNAGWKGRGLWAQYATFFVWHIEGGKGTTGKLAHFQLRPDPLAR